MNNDLFPFLAQNFGLVQGVLMNNYLYVDLTCLKAVLARRFAYPARPKACDKRRCTIVHRALSSGRRTPPGSKYTAKRQNIPNKANLNIFLTYLTKGNKRTYSDFYQKDVKKTNPILTIS